MENHNITEKIHQTRLLILKKTELDIKSSLEVDNFLEIGNLRILSERTHQKEESIVTKTLD